MPETPVASLDARGQKMVERARAAFEGGNSDYAIEICAQVLAASPGCLTVRRLQRAAQLRNYRNRSRLVARVISGLGSVPFLLGGTRRSPEEKMKFAENTLAKDPASVPALRLLAEAAREMGLPETVVFACEEIRELAPNDRENLLALGGAWLEAARPDEALRVADALLRKNPVDGGAQDLMRRASIAETLTRGNWEAAGSFREKLKSEKEAVSLEDADKINASEETAGRLIAEAVARIEKEPDNFNHYRTVITALRRLGRAGEALRWLERARQLPNAAADPTLAKLELDLNLADLRNQDALAAAGGGGASERQIASMLSYVASYPDDLDARYQCGKLLLENGRAGDAVAHFQKATKSPKLAAAAMLGLGRSFAAKGMLDLAVTQLEAAKMARPEMDDLKKETVYELGRCFELMKEPERAIEEFKLVYGEDAGFRDVAARVTEHYERRAQADGGPR